MAPAVLSDRVRASYNCCIYYIHAQRQQRKYNYIMYNIQVIDEGIIYVCVLHYVYNIL